MSNNYSEFLIVGSSFGAVVDGNIAVTLELDLGSAANKSLAFEAGDSALDNLYFRIQDPSGVVGSIDYNADRETLLVDPDPGSTRVTLNTQIPADLVPAGWQITPSSVWFEGIGGELYTDIQAQTRLQHAYARDTDGSTPTVTLAAAIEFPTETIQLSGTVGDPSATEFSSIYVDFGIDLNLDGDNNRGTYGDWSEVTYSTVRIDPSWIGQDGTFVVDSALTSSFYEMDQSLPAGAYVFVSNVLYVDGDGDGYLYGSSGNFYGMWSSALANDWNQEVFSIDTGEGPILENYFELDPEWLGAKFYSDDVPNAMDSVILFNATDTAKSYTVDGIVVNVAAYTVVFDPMGLNLSSDIVVPAGADEFSYRQQDDQTVDIVWLPSLDGAYVEWGPGNDVIFAPESSNYTIGDGLTLSTYSEIVSKDAYDSAGPRTPVIHTLVVTVGTKTVDHPYYGVGTDEAYYINGVESPSIDWIYGDTYVFDLSDPALASDNLGLYFDPNELGNGLYNGGGVSAGVAVSGTQGTAGATLTFVPTQADHGGRTIGYQSSAALGLGADGVANVPPAYAEIDWSDRAGLTVDNSTGVVTLDTEYGVFTAGGFNKFDDTAFADTFVGSDASEAFRFRHGGSDTVTGGGGSDQFRVEYRPDTWALRDADYQNESTLPYQIHVLDYEAQDEIRLEQMGFDASQLDQQISVSHRTLGHGVEALSDGTTLLYGAEDTGFAITRLALLFRDDDTPYLRFEGTLSQDWMTTNNVSLSHSSIDIELMTNVTANLQFTPGEATLADSSSAYGSPNRYTSTEVLADADSWSVELDLPAQGDEWSSGKFIDYASGLGVKVTNISLYDSATTTQYAQDTWIGPNPGRTGTIYPEVMTLASVPTPDEVGLIEAPAGQSYTYISVDTETYTQSELFVIDGDFVLTDSELYYYSDGRQVVSLDLTSQDPGVWFAGAGYTTSRTLLDGLVTGVARELEYDMPSIFEGQAGEGVTVNLSSTAQVLGGVTVGAHQALVGDGLTQYQVTPAVSGDTLWTNVTLSQFDDVVYVGADEGPVYFFWTPGNDRIEYAVREDNLFDWGQSNFNAFAFPRFSDGSSGGLTFDYSSGVLIVDAGDLGLTTVINVADIWDTAYDDTFIGSDQAEGFTTIKGGYDTVTAGAGKDKFEIRYYEDRASRIADDPVWAEMQGMHITDYESGEAIVLQAMGFGTSALTSLEAVYNDIIVSFDGTNTNISVVNTEVNLQNIVTLAGEFEVLSVEYLAKPTLEKMEPGESVLLKMQGVQQLITTTDLTGVAVGDLVESSFYEFDYFDLSSLSGEWMIDAGTGGWITEGAGYGSAVNWATGDAYDFTGFEGYIIAGNTDGTLLEYYGAEGISEIVVVEGGSDLFVDLGLDSTADVLSFRGTNDGVTIDLSAADQFGITGFDFAGNGAGSDGDVRGADYLFGSEAGDTFTGDTDAGNILAGYGGSDTLTGGDLSDVLIGGTGVDTLSGSLGNDVLIDLDDGTLTGGDGKDLFVVRGTSNTGGSNTEVADFELGTSGPGLGGGNKSFTDRIAFNFSVSALASTSLSAADGWLSELDYETLEDLITIDIVADTLNPASEFTITATLKASNQTGESPADITLGSLDVVLDPSTTLDTTKERLEYRVEDQEDFLASIKSTVLDQMLYNQSALDVSGTQTDTSQMLDDTVNLFISLVREDKFAVPGGQGKPVLVALRENGVDLGTNFRPGKGNEVITAGRASDKITIQRDEEMSLSDTYGRDTVVERGGDADEIIMPLIFQDILDNDDLDLSRTQRGREGEGKTLRIEYADSTPDETSINDVDLMVYKQYNDYSSSFRVENLTLYSDDGNGGYAQVQYDLGSVTATGLETTAKDAILVGRETITDAMVIKIAEGEAGIDKILDIVLADVTAEDTVSIEGYGNVTSVADGSETNSTTDHQVVTTDTGYTINLYFTDYSPTNDDWLLNTITA